jgi:hypothetical protein
VRTRGSLLVDARGDPRAGVILGLVAGALVLLSLGSFAALLFAGAGSPETLAVWVVAALVVVKVPLLILVWWLLGLKREQARSGGWSSDECAEILGYLEGQAQDSAGRPDAAARLAYFSREAWFVADAAADADKPAAVAAALRIDGLAQAARDGDGRGPAARGAGPTAGA